eukprot:3164386-Amphidinium_carterae.1
MCARAYAFAVCVCVSAASQPRFVFVLEEMLLHGYLPAEDYGGIMALNKDQLLQLSGTTDQRCDFHAFPLKLDPKWTHIMAISPERRG